MMDTSATQSNTATLSLDARDTEIKEMVLVVKASKLQSADVIRHSSHLASCSRTKRRRTSLDTSKLLCEFLPEED